MNTYETMKHNIPEGATHYSDASDTRYFSWYKKEGDKWFIQIWSDNGEWVECMHDEHIHSDAKPIPTEPTYRYEKVTDSIFDLKEEFERGELFTKKFNQEWHMIKSEEQLGGLLSMNDDPEKNGIYRRIEVTERDEFVEKAFGMMAHLGDDGAARAIANDMYEAGCRFVNGKG